MQAIKTKYLAPTDTRGPRIVASCDKMRKVYAYDHSLNVADNHAMAARRLVDELEWQEWFIPFASGDYGDATFHVSAKAVCG